MVGNRVDIIVLLIPKQNNQLREIFDQKHAKVFLRKNC